MNIVKSIKDHLLSLGPKSSALQLALKFQGRARGHHIEFRDGKIYVSTKGHRAVILEDDFLHVPIMSLFFKDFEGPSVAGCEMLDFTGPGIHKHRASGVELSFPGMPEEDSMPAYLHAFKPSAGNIVWDLGANAGMTTYFLSQLVGPSGHVYAFEPDDLNRGYLKENLKRLQIKNVTVLDWAVGKQSGKAKFSMEGSTASGLVECRREVKAENIREVEVVSLEDGANRLGRSPDYIKADIEGAEVSFVEGALEFLKTHPVHFAFESMHWMPGGAFSCVDLDRLFASIGYAVESSDRYGFIFTWASPKSESR